MFGRKKGEIGSIKKSLRNLILTMTIASAAVGGILVHRENVSKRQFNSLPRTQQQLIINLRENGNIAEKEIKKNIKAYSYIIERLEEIERFLSDAELGISIMERIERGEEWPNKLISTGNWVSTQIIMMNGVLESFPNLEAYLDDINPNIFDVRPIKAQIEDVRNKVKILKQRLKVLYDQYIQKK